MMFFNWRLFRRALRLSLWEQPFRLRRWTYVLFFSSLFLLFLGLVVIGRALDCLFFPGCRRQPVRQPVFIIAPPRSGTTLIQKLLSLDAGRFVHLKMYQTILPAVCFQRLVDLLAWVDTRLGRPLTRLLGWCERRWFGGWDNMHRMRLNQPEEDDALFLYAFHSEAVYLLFPFVRELWEAGFNDALAPDLRRRLMHYYRSCLQRHLYANGPGLTLLSKATQSSGAVEGLIEEFPDARFITIIRHPYHSIASHVSLFVPAWQAHSPEIAKDGPVSREYARQAVEWYKHLFHFRTKVDPRQYYCIDYRELIKDPRATVEGVYRHFDWSMSEGVVAALDDATRQQGEFRSKHKYSLEEFGLSSQWIREELKELFEAYRLDD